MDKITKLQELKSEIESFQSPHCMVPKSRLRSWHATVTELLNALIADEVTNEQTR